MTSKTMRSRKKILITFSNRAFQTNKIFYLNFIRTIESINNFVVIHRWFEYKEKNEIYAKTLNAISKADLIIIEASVSSTGIGQQIAYAIQRRKPVIICIKEKLKDKPVNIFLRKTKTGNMRFIFYTNLKNARDSIIETANKLKEQHLEKFNFVATKEIKKIISKEALRKDISQSELLREIITDWIIKQNQRGD